MTPLATVSLSSLDWAIVFVFFAIAIAIGIWTSKKAGRSETDFFLGGRNMPWWLLGFSMVATTFATDTPNLVTDIVRKDGVAGNWQWWAFLLTGMLTVFIYAKLWRRSGVATDVEFYELRYSGKPAAFLRGFRALYLGVVFNIMVMATVSLAAIKIGGIMLGLEPWECLLYSALVTLIFSCLGGLRGVLLTDFILFLMAMVGAVAAAYFALGHDAVGGMGGLLEKFESKGLSEKLRIFPSPDDPSVFVGLFIIPLAVQWWSVWYPGAEPGGGGYLAQRMLAAKNENHALGATLFFNVAHYAIRPWPWIIVALCSLLVFPDLASMEKAFPNAQKVEEDSAYSAMLTFLPAGWLGLVLTSLIAAYMSTISTHLNWGSSYVVNDFYARFIKPEASSKELVWVGRLSTVVMMILAGVIALMMKDALTSFRIILQIGAGTGLLFILRWFWWRINAWSEITAMTVSFLIAIILAGNDDLAGHHKLIIGVAITTVSWIVVTLLTRPDHHATLRNFIEVTNPGGKGWKKVHEAAEAEGSPITPKDSSVNLPRGILCMVFGCFAIYGFLFATGYFLYREYTTAITLSIFSAIGFGVLYLNIRRK